MNFIEKISNYVLGNFSRSQFPDIAITALNEGHESDSLCILAGLTDRDYSGDLDNYFNLSLNELGISLPNEINSAKILIRFYINEMISKPESAFESMSKIDNEIYKRVDWSTELKLPKKKYVGEELGLEKMYTWYRELQDLKDNSRLLYYNELPREKQKEKFVEHLIEEAKELRNKIELELSTHNKS